MWTGLGWPRIETGGYACECGNEPWGFREMRGIS